MPGDIIIINDNDAPQVIVVDDVDPGHVDVHDHCLNIYEGDAMANIANLLEIKFRVGDEGFPAHGATTFTPLNANGLPFFLGKPIVVYREGEKETVSTTKGITYIPETGVINFFPDLHEGEFIYISEKIEKSIVNPDGGSAEIAPRFYEHVQSSPGTTWTVTHNLGFFPSVSITTTAGDRVYGDVRYIDANTVELKFSAAFAGKAYLS